MGFLDSIAKAVSKAAVDKAFDAASNKAKELFNVPHASKGTEPQSASSSVSQEIGNVTFNAPSVADAKEHSCVFYDCDESEKEYEITQRFKLPNGFYEFSSGAGEVDCSYVYDPNFDESTPYSEWNPGDAAVMIGFENKHYEIVKAYENSNPYNGKIYKVSGSDKISYKTEFELSGEKYIAYHFRRGFDTKLYYQFCVQYGKQHCGTNVEEKALKALELMAATYTEIKKPE